jgi:ADP-heptose:LPS heptosyltransferase
MVLSSDNLFETARRLRALDLLITVDTMAAHLAGALGVRVWTLLHADADWRWLEQRRDSPWYPTMRLFRQERSGKWAPVIAAVSSELDLARFSSARRSGKAQAYSV